MYSQSRVIIEDIKPVLDCGAHSIKAIVGDTISVTASIIGDGHDVIAACLCYKHERDKKWKESRMIPLENDLWQAEMTLDKQGSFQYKLQGWVDQPLNWQHGIGRKLDDGQQQLPRRNTWQFVLMPLKTLKNMKLQ